jgi:hypothetical protein
VNWIPTATACDIVGISQSRQIQWAADDVIRLTGQSGCTKRDVIEMAVAFALAQRLKRLDQVRKAMRQLRPAFDRLPATGYCDILWDKQFRRAVWVTTDRALAKEARDGESVVVIPMANRLAKLRGAFRTELQDWEGRVARRSKLRVVR